MTEESDQGYPNPWTAKTMTVSPDSEPKYFCSVGLIMSTTRIYSVSEGA
jgi:hypothetical protein